MKSIVNLKRRALALLAIALVIGFSVTACDNGSKPKDPVNVDLQLPNISTVPAFTGTFVSNNTEQLDLVEDAVEALSDFTGALGDKADTRYSLLPLSAIPRGVNLSRTVQNEPFDYTFENEQLATGVTANGFLTGYYKTSRAHENTYTVGDYGEGSYRLKLSLDFNNIQRRNITFNGKYVYDENLYIKEQITSLSPNRMKGTIKLNANNGYALSVSKSGKGLKFVMKLTANCNFSAEVSDMGPDEDNFFADRLNLRLTIDIYDNSNVKQYTVTYTNLDDAERFLGDSIMGL